MKPVKKSNPVRFVIPIVMALYGVVLIVQSSPRYKKIVAQESQLAGAPVQAPASPMVQAPKVVTPAPESAVAPSAETNRESLLRLAQEDFQGELQELKKALPQVAAMKALTSDEAHDTPPVLIQAGMRLASLKERWLQAPHLRPLAQGFYLNCARASDLVLSVRALCLSHLRELGRLEGKASAEDQVPPEVRNLSDKI